MVLKILSKDIFHRSDAGGVKINLRSEGETRKAFNEIIENAKNFGFFTYARSIVTPAEA